MEKKQVSILEVITHLYVISPSVKQIVKKYLEENNLELKW